MPTLYIVDVKHGNSAVLVDDAGVIVIDAGRRADLLDFLHDKNISTIDILLLSHADDDHIGGAMSLLTSGQFQIKNVFLNTDSIKGTAIWDDLLCTLSDHQKRFKVYFDPSITPNLNGKLNQGKVEVEIMAPSVYLAAKGPGSTDKKKRKITSNSISAVIRLSVNNKPIAIFPGDIDDVGLYNLLEDGQDIKAWLAIFPHHGGNPGGKDVASFVIDFCKAVQPERIVFSIGNNQNKFPSAVVIQAIEKTLKNTQMYTTGSSDVLTAHITGNKGCSHKNCVGHIWLNFDKEPLEITYK
jgi:beta-lactamase superfamily II metal-dependent hydrolase